MSRPVHDVTAHAVAVAEDAAAAAEVVVHDLRRPEEMVRVARLFDEVWGRPDGRGAILGPEALVAMVHAGCQVSGAFRGGELVAATAAFLGRGATGTVHLHSHVTGVRDEVARAGVGAALKWHQRAWCLGRGIDEVRWTFDPLVRRNVVFNLVRLGALAVAYLPDVYGRLADARNVGQATDRLVVRWALTSPRVAAAAEGRPASPDIVALRRGGAEVVLDEDDASAPHLTVTEVTRRLVRMPSDIEGLRTEDPDLAAAWSAAMREAVGVPMDAGARITGATRDGWLVLSLGEGVADLRGGA